VVATIKPLSGGAKGIAKYFGLLKSATSYYVGESAGLWFGQASDLLNLAGPVFRSDFENLMAGRSSSGNSLEGIRSNSSKRVPGYDVTFSAPKPVSALWAIAERRQRQKIVASVMTAVKQTVTGLERDIPVARRGGGGRHEIFAKIVSAMFLHTLSRAQDPQLHVHCVIANVCRGEDGKWSAVNSRKLHEWTMTLGSIFRSHLCNELQQNLNLETYTPLLPNGQEADWFELKCIPQSLSEAFSKRRAQIKKLVAPENMSNAQARQKANFATRAPKSEPEDLTELHSEWKAEAVKHGVDLEQLNQELLERQDIQPPEQQTVEKEEQREEIQEEQEVQRSQESVEELEETEQPRQREPHVTEPSATEQPATEQPASQMSKDTSRPDPKWDKLYEKCFEETVRELASKHAYYTDSRFTSALTDRLRKQGANVGVAGIIGRVREDLRSRDSVVSLQGSKPKLFSSREYFEKEERLVEDAKFLVEKTGAKVDLRTIHKFSHDGRGLSEEQSKAVFHLLGQSSGLRVLTGVAGSGKSSTLESVREGFQKAGHSVVGTALSGKASSELEAKTGIPTRTVASYLYHLDRSEARKIADTVGHEVKMLGRAANGKRRWEKDPVQLPKKGVLVVDEAGMLDTHSMGRLLHHARKAECTVVLAGDSEQLPPINVGGPLGFLQDQAGYADLPTNHRQKHAADREALERLREGNVGKALASYDKRDQLKITGSPEQALVDEWAQSGALRKPKDHVILTPTRRQEASVNRMCQEKLLDSKRFQLSPSIRHGEGRYHIGDRVRFRRPQRKQGIENGDLGTVVGVNPITRSISVRLDNEPSAESKRKFGARQVATVSLLKLDKEDMTLGYASTTHAAQGATYDHAWVLLDGGHSSKELAYTQLSRGRKSTHLCAAEQRESRAEDLQRLEASLANETKKNLAHDMMLKNEITYEH